MKRSAFAILAAATVMLSSARGLAQPAPSAPAPASGAPPSASAAPAFVARLHVHTRDGKGTAHVSIRRPDGSQAVLCDSPCVVDVPVNSELRITRGADDDAHTFVVPATLGPEIDVEVRPPASGALIGSIVLMGAGGAFLLSGVLLIALAEVTFPSTTEFQKGRPANPLADTYRTTGYVFLGIGAAAALGGLIVYLARSHEPRVFDSPYRTGGVDGRREILLGDVASLRARDAATGGVAPAPAVLPIQYGFAF